MLKCVQSPLLWYLLSFFIQRVVGDRPERHFLIFGSIAENLAVNRYIRFINVKKPDFLLIIIMEFKFLKKTVLLLLVVQTLVFLGYCQTGVDPIWIEGTYWKCGTVSVRQTSSNRNTSITYNTPHTVSTLRKPVMGLADCDLMKDGDNFYMEIVIVQYTVTGFKFNLVFSSERPWVELIVRYFALDTSFPHTFSMTHFNPSINRNGTIDKSYYVNFTRSTGVTLDTSNENVLLPFMHLIEFTKNNDTTHITLDFTLQNQSYYKVRITAQNIYLKNCGFSRIIFDKTTIEALGDDYFDYGSVTSTNTSSVSVTLPEIIIDNNLHYGMHDFHSTNLNHLRFKSPIDISTGFIPFQPAGGFSYSRFKFSYIHHRTRTCPTSNPYYNISEILCYDQCNTRWYEDNSTMRCQPCLWDCYTCHEGSTCATCNATTDFRQIQSNRCVPITGYYENGTNNTKASQCTSPCATCVNSDTYCTSCISGYYLNRNTCTPCSSAIPDCNTCDNSSFCTLCSAGGNGSSCTVCTATQYVVGFVCFQCNAAVTNCQSCTDASTCTLCQSNYTLLSATSCDCTSTQYDTGSVCITCSDTIDYCQQCTSVPACTTCATTFVVSGGSCVCNGTAFLNATAGQCELCSAAIPFCQSCTDSTTCSSCYNNITLATSTVCNCSAGFYPSTSTNACQSCPVSISNCIECTDSTTCTVCDVGYELNTTTNDCFLQPCQISNCDTCDTGNYSICLQCDSGYSLSSTNTSCDLICGDGNKHDTQTCDDGNTDNGDGCNSTCAFESSFTCIAEYISATQTISLCFYSGSLTFSKVWIRKVEGQNSLEFSLQLGQSLTAWPQINFDAITEVSIIDQNTKLSKGQTFISSLTTSYDENKNRLSVTIDYINYDLQQKLVRINLSPYSSGNSIFTIPDSLEFTTPLVEIEVTVLPDNNQNANLYTEEEYNLQIFSQYVTYCIAGIAIAIIITSLVFRKGTIFALETLVTLQMTYFSLAFLDYMNPTFTGLLTLRYFSGIVNFRTVHDYLEELDSPSAMKGIYVFLNLSNNFTFVSIAMGVIIGIGIVLLLVYLVIDWCANKNDMKNQRLAPQQKKGYPFYKLAFYCLGELGFVMLNFCLPLFTICLFFQVMYTTDSRDGLSIGQGIIISLAFLGYFIALIKQTYPVRNQFSKMGEYISEFSNNSIYKKFKFYNVQMIIRVFMSALIILLIRSGSKIFASFLLIFICFLEIVGIVITNPFKYGFISCCGSNQDNKTFDKLELYKKEEKPEQSSEKSENEKSLQRPDDSENQSQLFMQHINKKEAKLRNDAQGLIKDGQILNHSKIYLFNNNWRKIMSLITIIAVQFVFISTKLYEDEITQSYQGYNIKAFLPFIIHFVLLFNVVYSYIFVFLQIKNGCGDGNKVENDNENLQLGLRTTMGGQTGESGQFLKVPKTKAALNNVKVQDFESKPDFKTSKTKTVFNRFQKTRPKLPKLQTSNNRRNRQKQLAQDKELDQL